MSLPVIGIICKCERPNPKPRSPNYYSPKNDLYPYGTDTLINAIFASGGTPLLLPMPRNLTEGALDHRESNLPVLQIMRRSLEVCQGLILQDGNDMFPYEQAIAREAYERDIPLLGIGSAFGTMVKVADFRSHPVSRYMRSPYGQDENIGPGVCISVVEGTHLYRAVRAKSLIVHHSGYPDSMYSPSPGLVVSALMSDRYPEGPATDDYPEAYEATDKKFYVAVRFRPDYLFSDQDGAGNLLRYFVSLL